METKTQTKIVWRDTSVVAWVDIPVNNLKRASNFYSKVLGLDFTIDEIKGIKMAFCPHSYHETTCCLIQEEDFRPSRHGMLVYLNVNGRATRALEEVIKNGGKILSTQKINPHGLRAIIIDSEGNRIALQAY